MMKAKELRSLSKAELYEKCNLLREELYRLNYQRKSGRVEKPHRFAQIKKDIARIKTIIRELEVSTNSNIKS